MNTIEISVIETLIKANHFRYNNRIITMTRISSCFLSYYYFFIIVYYDFTIIMTCMLISYCVFSLILEYTIVYEMTNDKFLDYIVTYILEDHDE